MKVRFYKYSTFLFTILVALSFYKNQEAINLFSIVSAVVSIILGIYSLITSSTNNMEASKSFKDLEVINTKIDMKLDNLKDEVRSIKIFNDSNDDNLMKNEKIGIQDNILQYIANVNPRRNAQINEIDETCFSNNLSDELKSYASKVEIITATLLYELSNDSFIKSFTVCVIIKGALNKDKLNNIVQDILSKNNGIITYEGNSSISSTGIFITI